MNSTNTLDKQFSPVGAMFMSVGKNTWKLGDIKPKEGTFTFKDEFLQEFDPNSGAIGQKYTYVDASTATTKNPMRRWANPSSAIGWWKLDTVGGMASDGPGTAVKADEVSFKAGQGLYSNFMYTQAKFDCSGEVVCEEWQLDLSGKQFSAIINYLARPILLKEIVPEEGSFTFKDEFLQEFDPNSGAIGQKYTYVDANTAATKNPMRRWANPSSAIGWWKLDTVGGMASDGPGTAVKADDVEIQPGAGFYSNFMYTQAKLNFPSSIPAEKDAE